MWQSQKQATQGTADLVYTHALFVHDPNSGTVQEFVISSNTIDLSVTQAPGIIIEDPDDVSYFTSSPRETLLSVAKSHFPTSVPTSFKSFLTPDRAPHMCY